MPPEWALRIGRCGCARGAAIGDERAVAEMGTTFDEVVHPEKFEAYFVEFGLEGSDDGFK